jgi:hypothetical protein
MTTETHLRFHHDDEHLVKLISGAKPPEGVDVIVLPPVIEASGGHGGGVYIDVVLKGIIPAAQLAIWIAKQLKESHQKTAQINNTTIQLQETNILVVVQNATSVVQGPDKARDGNKNPE